MVPASTGHGADGRPAGRGRSVVCGTVGLGIVIALFVLEYSAIVTLTEDALGLLSSTAIVWLFIAGWLLVWLGVEVALDRIGWPRSKT